MRKLILGLFMIVFLTACNKDDDTTDAMTCDPEMDFPYLKVGHELNYLLDELFSSDLDWKLSIVSESEPGLFKIEHDTESAFIPEEVLWYSCGGTITSPATATSSRTDNPFIQVDTEVGTTWTSTSGSGSEGTYEVVEKNVSVTTPAGTFACDKVTFNLEGTFNVDTIYQNTTVGTVLYDGVLLSYELQSKNF